MSLKPFFGLTISNSVHFSLNVHILSKSVHFCLTMSNLVHFDLFLSISVYFLPIFSFRVTLQFCTFCLFFTQTYFWHKFHISQTSRTSNIKRFWKVFQKVLISLGTKFTMFSILPPFKSCP